MIVCLHSRQLDGARAERSSRELADDVARHGDGRRHRVRCRSGPHDARVPLLPSRVRRVPPASKDAGRTGASTAARSRKSRSAVATGRRSLRLTLERSYRLSGRKSNQNLPPDLVPQRLRTSSSGLLRRRPLSASRRSGIERGHSGKTVSGVPNLRIPGVLWKSPGRGDDRMLLRRAGVC